MNSTYPTPSDAVPDKPSRSQIVLWVIMGYLVYVGVCFAMESYGRHRFEVQRDSEIAQITERRAHLLALTRKASALAELEQWLPYKIYVVGSLVIWALLAVATGIAAFRTMVKKRTVAVVHFKLLAVGIALPSLFVLMLGVLPPLLVQKGWEKYPWLSW